MNYFVYILRSEKSGRFYIGQTHDLGQRLKRHNGGRSTFTKTDRPWDLIFSESYSTRSEAVRRERYLKSPQGWKELKEIKKVILSNSERGAAR